MPVFVPTTPADPIGPWVELTLQGEANLLSAAEAGNSGAGGGAWAGTGCSLATAGPTAPDGSFSMTMTSTGGGTISAQSSKYAVVPGQSYSGLAAFQAATTGRSTQVQLVWYNVSNTVISTSSGAFSSDFAGSYTSATVSAVAPPTAATVALQVVVTATATSEVHDVASRGIFPGVVTTWSEGGQAGLESATAQYSDDGTTWVTVPYANLPVSLPAPSQQATVTDWTPFPNTPRQYRTQTTDSNGKVSAWSAPISATTSPDRYWLIDVAQPDANGRVPISRLKGGSSGGASSGLETSQAWQMTQAQSVSYGLDEQYPVVLQGATQGMTTSLMALVQGQAAKNQLVNLWKRRRTLRLSTDGYEAFWVTVGSSGGSNTGITIEMLRDLPAERRANPWWVVTMPLVEMAAP
jgi:hypothetical protein